MERIEKTIDVNAPVKAAYAQCLRFSDYPRFMEGVREVRIVDDRHLHWIAGQPDKMKEWTSVITEREPDKSLAWRDRDGGNRTVMLSFAPLDPDKTRIKITIEYEAHAAADGTDEFFTDEQRLAGNLERLKKLLENEGHDWNEWPSTHQSQPEQQAQSIPLHDAAGGPANPAGNQNKSAGESAAGSRSGQAHKERRGLSNPIEGLHSVQGLLQGWDQPFTLVKKISGEMDQLFERLIGRPVANKWGYGVPGKWVPTVEVAQRGQEFVVSVDLPGVDKKDVHIDISDGKLNIEGERRGPEEQKTLPGYRRSERHYGRFYRQVPLPPGTAPDKIRATLLNGVLEIRMPLPSNFGKQGHRVDIEDRS